jgi:lipase chaperone LimK
MKSELAQSRKDKQRIEKQLESKEQYLATIKTRQEKQPVEHIEETTRLKELKDLRSTYDNKLKHLRREKEEVRTAL